MRFILKGDESHAQSLGWDYKSQETPQQRHAPVIPSLTLLDGGEKGSVRSGTAGRLFSTAVTELVARPTAGGGVRRRIPSPSSTGGGEEGSWASGPGTEPRSPSGPRWRATACGGAASRCRVPALEAAE